MNLSKKKDPRFWALWKRCGAVKEASIFIPTRPEIRFSFNEFLYPTIQQFPFDAVCRQIVRELEKRNWQVPGISVGFHEYGTGTQKLCCVSNITGNDFKLHFCRVQRTRPDRIYNDMAAVDVINIPKKEIRVYGDGSGPTFYLYVGNNWKKDKEKFVNAFKVGVRPEQKPFSYLEYTGNGRKRTEKNQSVLWLENRTNAEPDDKPLFFMTEEVMEEFREYLAKIVLKAIMTHPVPEKDETILSPPASIPFPQNVIASDIFVFGDWRDAKRIETGKKDLDQLIPEDQYGMSGSYRLMSLDIRNDGSVPKVAYDGFLWCGIAPAVSQTPIDNLKVPGNPYSSSFDQGKFLIRIVPKSANDIYIADHALYENRREELGNAMEEERDRFTDAEIADFNCARGRSIIPISEYQGGFIQPIILINRELSLDEVEIVSGPHKKQH